MQNNVFCIVYIMFSWSLFTVINLATYERRPSSVHAPRLVILSCLLVANKQLQYDGHPACTVQSVRNEKSSLDLSHLWAKAHQMLRLCRGHFVVYLYFPFVWSAFILKIFVLICRRKITRNRQLFWVPRFRGGDSKCLTPILKCGSLPNIRQSSVEFRSVTFVWTFWQSRTWEYVSRSQPFMESKFTNFAKCRNSCSCSGLLRSRFIAFVFYLQLVPFTSGYFADDVRSISIPLCNLFLAQDVFPSFYPQQFLAVRLFKHMPRPSVFSLPNCIQYAFFFLLSRICYVSFWLTSSIFLRIQTSKASNRFLSAFVNLIHNAQSAKQLWTQFIQALAEKWQNYCLHIDLSSTHAVMLLPEACARVTYCSHSFPFSGNHSNFNSHPFPFIRLIPLPIFPTSLFPFPLIHIPTAYRPTYHAFKTRITRLLKHLYLSSFLIIIIYH